VCGLQCDLGYWLQRIGVVVDSDLACGTKLDHLAKGVLGRGCWVSRQDTGTELWNSKDSNRQCKVTRR